MITMPRLLQLISTQPQLLADHAGAYVDLLAAEIDALSASLRRQALLNAVALCGLGTGIVLAGVALMLWAVVPAAEIHAPWALLVAPLLPLAAAAVCLVMARTGTGTEAFDQLRQQLAADLLMLREAGAP